MAYKRTNRLLCKRNESKINIILTRSPVMGGALKIKRRIMTRTIFYKGKLYNGIFVSIYKGIYNIYIDRQARLAILIDSFGVVKAIVKLESYNIDVLIDNEDDEFIDELERLENKFDDIM